jgi:hypothetical protein
MTLLASDNAAALARLLIGAAYALAWKENWLKVKVLRLEGGEKKEDDSGAGCRGV